MNQPLRLKINNTSLYHLTALETLGWELTVCNTLEPPDSPARSILQNDDTYGNHLIDFLEKHISLDKVSRVLEVGGGYGYIMRDILLRYPTIDSVMLDISPYLLQQQKKTLAGFNTGFIEQDFFTADKDFLASFDLAILNENVGDFPTVVELDSEIVMGHDDYGVKGSIKRFLKRYDLDVPPGLFNLNLGALEAVEKFCSAGVGCIFISEHSCEAETPDYMKGKIDITATGNPERISLKGHDEYTIRFSHLAKVAEHWGYRTVRGRFADFIPFEMSGRVNFILTSNSEKDEHEIVRLFIDDLFKYEYLLLIKD